MENDQPSILAGVVTRYKEPLLQAWMKSQLEQLADRQDVITENELREQSSDFLDLLERALATAGDGLRIQPAMWQELHRSAHAMARNRAAQGFTAAETATFIFGLKRLLFARLRDEVGDSEALIDAVWQATTILDRLGLFTTEVFLQSREDIIKRQQQEMIELSTPVVNLWEGILAVPLIGTLDSARTQTVTESLLDKILQTGADVAIIDITGVPVVDTLVAQHLLKTVAAARLMGAECIISGIRPQIAQTIVHLGVDLAGVTTKADLSTAFAYALQRKGFSVGPTIAV